MSEKGNRTKKERGTSTMPTLDITEHERAEEALRKAHDELEMRVEERTAELTKANEELRIEMTARKQMEEALKDSGGRYRSLVNNIKLGILRSTPGPPGRILEVNPAMEEITGYSREELLKMDIRKMYVNLEERKAIVEELVSTRGKVARELRWRKKDGSEMVVLNRVIAVRDDTGKVLYLDAIMEDITERKRAEQLYRTLATSSPVGVYIAQEGNFVFINPQFQKYMGFTEDELLGRDSLSLVHPEDREMVRENAVAMLKGKRSSPYEFRYIDKSGETIWAIETVTSTHYKGERAALGNFMDITERKQAEQRIEQANIRLQEMDRLKSIFLASMSHELRTPLNSIIGFTDLILEGMVGEINEEQRSQLTLVKCSADHLLSLINDVLDISKIEAGKVEVSLEEFKLDDIMGEVVESFSPIADLKSIGVFKEVPGGITLFSDRRRVKQVLMNLVSNAVKFTEQGGVKIVARVLRGDILEISVIDTGTGIRKEDMNRLFVPFQQVDESLTKKHEGTGLGLHLTQKLVTLLGGNISAKSEYGKGSEFTFTIPLQYVEVQRNAKSASSRG